MGADRAFVGIDLSKEQWLNESPCAYEKVKIPHRTPEFKGAQHISLYIDVAGKISITDPAFVDASYCTQASPIMNYYAKAWCFAPEALNSFVGQNDVE
jgi:hypothetical protein